MNVAILVSGKGRGTNAEALMRAATMKDCPFRVAVVVSAAPGHGALERADRMGVPTQVVNAGSFKGDQPGFERVVLNVLEEHGVEVVALAGFMRRLSPEFTAHFHHRIVNVHPSLLPAFGGKGMYGRNVHQAVLEYGAKISGCTVHLADEHYDTGPIILQKTVPVLPDDTPELLAARILPQEHAGYVEALTRLAEGRLAVIGRRVREVPSGLFLVMGEWGRPTAMDDPGLLEEVFKIRRAVFCEEQGVPVEEELDDLDVSAWHFLAFVNGAPAGTARLVQTAGAAKIGRMAVLARFRGRGVGTRLLETAMHAAKELKLNPTILDAQVAAIPFYERLGFVAEGVIFDDAGIPHRRMCRPTVD